MSTATGSRVAFHVYCHFLVAVEVAVEMAVDFQSGSRKKMAVEKLATINNRSFRQTFVLSLPNHFFDPNNFSRVESNPKRAQQAPSG